MPEDWLCVAWKAGGGYDGQNRDKDNQNRAKERIWLSPYCLNPDWLIDMAEGDHGFTRKYEQLTFC